MLLHRVQVEGCGNVGQLPGDFVPFLKPLQAIAPGKKPSIIRAPSDSVKVYFILGPQIRLSIFFIASTFNRHFLNIRCLSIR